MKKFSLYTRIMQFLGVRSKCCGKPMDSYGYNASYCMDEYGGCGKKQ